jgi:hypothetical protein
VISPSTSTIRAAWTASWLADEAGPSNVGLMIGSTGAPMLRRALFEAIRYPAAAGGSVDDAVAELRELANGRGDLLAEQAGLMTGYAEVAPVTDAHRLAARLLVLAAGRTRTRCRAGSRSVGSERRHRCIRRSGAGRFEHSLMPMIGGPDQSRDG